MKLPLKKGDDKTKLALNDVIGWKYGMIFFIDPNVALKNRMNSVHN